jgi:hypothetical protein
MSDRPMNRRTWIKDMAGKAALAGMAGMAVATQKISPARADSNLASQSSAGYMAAPGPAGAHCAICTLFVPASDPTAPGTCQAVAGTISPNGYCNYYSAKS